MTDDCRYLGRWSGPFCYDELESETAGDPDRVQGNARAAPPAKVCIESFDLWVKNSYEPPDKWITNHR